jgi:drug/metabolite transporter (DMT)-like permease
LWPLLLIFKVPVKGNKKGIPSILIAGILLAFYSYLFYKGLKFGKAGAGGVLVTTLNPIIAYTLGIFINKRIPSKIESTGLLCGLLAGCILLKIWDQTTSVLDSGNLFFLAASFVWALMSVFTSKAKKFGTSFGFSLWQYIISILCIIPMTNMREIVSIFSINDSTFWLNMIFSASIVTALATTFFFYATTKIGPEKASSYIFLVPFAAETSSWILLNEPLLLHTIIGGLIGIVAVYLINRKT